MTATRENIRINLCLFDHKSDCLSINIDYMHNGKLLDNIILEFLPSILREFLGEDIMNEYKTPEYVDIEPGQGYRSSYHDWAAIYEYVLYQTRTQILLITETFTDGQIVGVYRAEMEKKTKSELIDLILS